MGEWKERAKKVAYGESLGNGFEPIIELVAGAGFDSCDGVDVGQSGEVPPYMYTEVGPADKIENIKERDLASAFEGKGPCTAIAEDGVGSAFDEIVERLGDDAVTMHSRDATLLLKDGLVRQIPEEWPFNV